MGNDPHAVVDSALKLKGFGNLQIVDACAISTITSGPIHASVLAVAESFASCWSDL